LVQGNKIQCITCHCHQQSFDWLFALIINNPTKLTAWSQNYKTQRMGHNPAPYPFAFHSYNLFLNVPLMLFPIYRTNYSNLWSKFCIQSLSCQLNLQS
jgi:hypothetical protein